MATVAVVADLHVLSTVGLCPPRVQLDDGGTYQASPGQRWLYRSWLDYWRQVWEMPRPIYAVVAGDAIEGVHHETTQLGTLNLTTQVQVAADLLDPVAQQADHLFILRGTEAHTGPSCHFEEQVATDLEAEPDPMGKTASWWHLFLEVEGVRFDIGHHPQARGHLPHTRDAAASRQAAIVWQEYHEMGERPPDVVLRGHVHYFAVGWSREVLAVQIPPWKLTDSYGRFRGAGRRVEPIGGLWFQCEAGRYQWDAVRYRPRRRPAWRRG